MVLYFKTVHLILLLALCAVSATHEYDYTTLEIAQSPISSPIDTQPANYAMESTHKRSIHQSLSNFRQVQNALETPLSHLLEFVIISAGFCVIFGITIVGVCCRKNEDCERRPIHLVPLQISDIPYLPLQEKEPL